ncbi:hypothetical protein PENTCL1PPCAC_2261 [Pristionchus entomophagus]|uniref:non-specific serine/threonine protein kinase n=1 Tax=Pristionchus entomophagus TaxID=358040 RepID=A0AAV5SA66_9BILA|nr:hypothetical protein PENTCL1PPCAC_2261 [Pristionchus entomophagus]
MIERWNEEGGEGEGAGEGGECTQRKIVEPEGEVSGLREERRERGDEERSTPNPLSSRSVAMTPEADSLAHNQWRLNDDDDEIKASGSLDVGGLAPLQIGRSNTLHLSVGAPSDEDDDDEDMDEASSVRASISAWHRISAASHREDEPLVDGRGRGKSPLGVLPGIGGGRRRGGEEERSASDEVFQYGGDMDVHGGIPSIPSIPSIYQEDEHFAAALHDILQTGERLFQPIDDNNFVEEVWAKKDPKIIHGYLFGGLIGEGSYAKVKEVVEEDSLVRRAVKIIKDGRLRKIPNGKENVERELKILKKVTHPNVIQLVETFRDSTKGKLYMVLEYCVVSIQQILDGSETKRMDEPEVHAYFGQLIKGLEYLQSVGVVHKDIKPGNLLVTRSRILKISDFGVAEQLSPFKSDDRIDNAQGTPKFQPPEAVSGHSNHYGGFGADVWASGVTLYNMLSGEYPFEGAVIMKLFDAIATQPLIMPTKVALKQEVVDLMRGLLDKDPNTRWTIETVREYGWMKKRYDQIKYTPFPPHKDDPVHRPLTVVNALEAMYLTEEECDRRGVPLERTDLVNTDPGEETPPSLPSLPTRPPRRNRSFIPSCFRGQE